jgi:hypothetical protein
MTLLEKIIALYPELKQEDFLPEGCIGIRNDSDGNGDYIEKWDHPTLPKPTKEQLA